MEKLPRRGSRRPSGGADEREGKVAVEGVVQKRWLLQRSLEGTALQREWLDKPCLLTNEQGSFSEVFF